MIKARYTPESRKGIRAEIVLSVSEEVDRSLEEYITKITLFTKYEESFLKSFELLWTCSHPMWICHVFGQWERRIFMKYKLQYGHLRLFLKDIESRFKWVFRHGSRHSSVMERAPNLQVVNIFKNIIKCWWSDNNYLSSTSHHVNRHFLILLYDFCHIGTKSGQMMLSERISFRSVLRNKWFTGIFKGSVIQDPNITKISRIIFEKQSERDDYHLWTTFSEV